MNGSFTFGIGSGAGNYPLRSAPFRVAKSFAANRFHDEREREQSARDEASANHTSANPSRFETVASSDWYGARLNPAFVAQVLGQVLMQNKYEPGSALAAYGEPARRFALACDLRA